MDNPSDVTYSYKMCKKPLRLSIDNLFELVKQSQSKSITFQILDPTWLVSKKHLQVAVYHTINAFNNKTNIARGRETELLIRLSGLSQIKNAVTAFGIDEHTETLLLIAFGGTSKENQSSLEQFYINTKLEEIKDIEIPLTDLKKMLKYYKVEEDPSLLEKIVLEKIATVEIS